MAGGIAAWFSQYAFIIGFPLGLALYTLLMKTIVLPGNPQAEISSGYADEFLATSEGVSWVYLGKGRFQRMSPAQTRDEAISREDL